MYERRPSRRRAVARSTSSVLDHALAVMLHADPFERSVGHGDLLLATAVPAHELDVEGAGLTLPTHHARVTLEVGRYLRTLELDPHDHLLVLHESPTELLEGGIARISRIDHELLHRNSP